MKEYWIVKTIFNGKEMIHLTSNIESYKKNSSLDILDYRKAKEDELVKCEANWCKSFSLKDGVKL